MSAAKIQEAAVKESLAWIQAYQKNRKLIWIIIICIGIVIFIYYKGKKAGATIIPDAPYIKGKEAIPSGFNPNILADQLHEAMSGLFTMSGTKDNVWNQLATLQTDDMIISVYNAFNNKYASEAKGSLTQWIRDEYYYDPTTGVKDKVLKKLQSLRLN